MVNVEEMTGGRLKFTESVGRCGVPDDVLLKVRVVVRRLATETAPGSGPGDSSRSLKLWRRRTTNSRNIYRSASLTSCEALRSRSEVVGLFGRTDSVSSREGK